MGGKTESLFLQRKNPRRIAWTQLYRRAHKKGITEETAKKRSRKTVKHQRGIVGADLSAIAALRNQTAQARTNQRQAAIAKAKAEKKEKEKVDKKMKEKVKVKEGVTEKETITSVGKRKRSDTDAGDASKPKAKAKPAPAPAPQPDRQASEESHGRGDELDAPEEKAIVVAGEYDAEEEDGEIYI